MPERRLGLRTIVFLGGATLMLVPALLAASFYTAALQKRAEALQVEKLTMRGELSANLLARRLNSVWMDVSKLATTIDPDDPTEAQDQITFMTRIDNRYSWLGIANLDGKVLAAKDGLLDGVSVAERPWFKRGLVAPTVIGVHEADLLARLLPHAEEPRRFINMSAPLQRNGSQTKGVIGAHLDWKWVAEGLASLQAPGIDVLLLSRDRTVLFGPSELANKQLNVGSALAASRVTSAFLDERWPDGKEYLTVIVPTIGYGDLPSFGWSLLIRQDMDSVLGPTRELIRSFWVTLGTGALVALILLMFGAQWLATPLRRLCAGTEAILENPNTKPPYEETRFDEAAKLSSNLTRLQAKLMHH